MGACRLRGTSTARGCPGGFQRVLWPRTLPPYVFSTTSTSLVSNPGKCTYHLLFVFAEITLVTNMIGVAIGNQISVLCNVAVHAIEGLHFDATLLRFVLLACPAVYLNLSKLWSLRPPLSWRVNKI